MSGRFVTFEGGEGAGKSTQARLLADGLRSLGHEVLLTREPGGTAGAEAIRTLLLDPAGEWSLPAEILLHFAARADHLERAILPALSRGAWVVCDRFFDSTVAYQGQGEGRTLIERLVATLPVRPDLTFILDVDAATRQARVAARRGATDRYETRDEAFHARVAEAYRAIAAAEPGRCVLVDASLGVEEISGIVRETVGALPQAPLGAGAPRPA